MGKDADNLLYQLRVRSGFDTQRALAAASGVHPQTICYVENGKRKVRLRNAVRLADALGVRVEELEPLVADSIPSSMRSTRWRARRRVGTAR